ncbi:MAG: replicative DNA helicase [Planctomycetia bacterium]|nr:replicative DNA helicase [Planctomycetia bacterium]
MAEKKSEKKKTTFEKNDVVSPGVSLVEPALPQNVDMERALLGSILLEPIVLDDVLPLVRESDFYLTANQIVFRHLVDIYTSGRQIDSTILLESLQKNNDLSRIGGISYLVEIVHSVAIAAHAVAYSEIIRDKSRLRQLIHACTNIIQSAYDPAADVNELISQSEEQIFAVHDSRSNDSVVSMYNILTEVWDKIDSFEEGGALGLMTGFTDLDQMTGGLHNSELIILAARPSMGKTAFATNIADQIAIDQNKGVLFVSLEMARAELVTRILCGRAKVDSQKMRQGRITPQERRDLQTASSSMMRAPFHIDDTPSRTVSEIAAQGRRLKRKGQLDLIVIDYLQLIREDNSRDARQEQVSKIARRLKELARELQVPVICLSQLNRQTESSGDHRPKLSQLRESGAIEQDADVVMFVHREEYYHAGDKDHIEKKQLAGKAEIIIAKQRNGPTGIVNLQWESKFTQFRNLMFSRREEFEDFGS